MKFKFLCIFLLFTIFNIIAGNVTTFGNDSTSYIRLKTIQKDYTDTLSAIFGNDKLKYLLIDLRDNTGGPLDGILIFAEMIVPKKSLIVTIWDDKNSQKNYFTNNSPILSKKVTIAILVNHLTSSGAEIIAGCLQDYDRAIIIGDTTNGNGSILDNNKKIIGKAALPSGRLIDRGVKSMKYQTLKKREMISGFGIIPDFNIKLDQPDSTIIKNSMDLMFSNQNQEIKRRRRKK